MDIVIAGQPREFLNFFGADFEEIRYASRRFRHVQPGAQRGILGGNSDGAFSRVTDTVLLASHRHHGGRAHGNGVRAHSQRLGEIVTLKDRISSLEAQVRQLSAEVADLQTEKRRLEGQVADLQDDITGLKETIEKNDTYIKELEKENKELREGEGVDVADRDVAVAAKYMSPGDKGTVVSVNETWNFAVLNLGDDVLKELVADDGNLVLPFEFFLKRPSKDGTVVGKIRLIQVNMDEKLGIADILEDWLQVDVKSGDVVFH